jgi:hypothetical protein
VQLGLENKKKMYWAIGLGAFAVLVLAYQLIPVLIPTSTPASSAEAAAPIPVPARGTGRTSTKAGKTPKLENLDPRLRLDLLAASENTQYQGTGRNIFVSQAEEVKIPTPVAPPVTDTPQAYAPPAPPPPAPIPLKFYGFASSPGEPKKIFLKNGDDVFVAGEGEIVDRRYKVIRITNTSVEIQDVVGSGPPQNIPLTQG